MSILCTDTQDILKYAIVCQDKFKCSYLFNSLTYILFLVRVYQLIIKFKKLFILVQCV